jgi:hypothetical protein
MMWKNMVKSEKATGDNIIRRMRVPLWITKARDTHSEYVILIDLPQQQKLYKLASMLHYYVRVHRLSC